MKILYLSTFFHEYHDKIIEHLTVNLGNKVERFVLEKRSTYLSLLRLLSINGYQQTRHKQYLKILSFSDDYDLVFIQSPYFLPIDILSSLRKKLKRAKFISYSWDSIKSLTEVNYFDFFDRFMSFDPVDCQNFSALKYLPLFYINDFYPIKHKKTWDLAFIGGIGDSKDRHQFILEIKNQCKNHNINFYCYARIPFFYFIKSLLKGKYYKGVKFSPISLKKISQIYNNSTCVLDHNNSLQNGLTIRTFEAIASGCRLITTNKSILAEPFYDKRYIDIIERNKPILKKEFLFANITIDNLYLKDFTNYSLESWVKKVFYE